MMNYISSRERLGISGAGDAAITRDQAAPELRPVGDRALLADFSGVTGAGDVSRRVLELDQAITRARIGGVIECVVAYQSLLVCYDPLCIAPERLEGEITRLLASREATTRQRRRWRIPVAYGGDFGPDLEAVAAHCGTTPADVVGAHAAAIYRVAMFGFLPGFAYLQGLPPRLAVPRRATPRTRVPAGGIGIGGAQTAIGSIAGPSGWHQIGRTPVRTFAPTRQPVTFLDIGDEIEIACIDAGTFARLAEAAAAGEIVAEVVP